LSRGAGDRYTLEIALNNLGEVQRSIGDYDRATSLYEESFALSRELDSARIAVPLVNLGEMALLAAEPARARGLLLDALELARGIGNKRDMLFALNDLGWVAL